MRILISAGGTGGHVYPAVALAEKLLARGNELNWIGRPESLEAAEARRLGVPFVSIPLVGFKRKLSLSNLSALLLFYQGRKLVSETLTGFRPHLLFALGSYVSAPAISAALSKRVPVIVHEQNVVPGLVVRFFSRRVDAVALTKPLVQPIQGITQVVGLPLRPGICLQREESFYRDLGLDSQKKTLFVFGGSQGAKRLCEVSLELSREWMKDRPRWQILLQTGKRNFEEVLLKAEAPNVTPIEHISEMGKAYACADAILSRSGATSCEEIAAVGKPAILVPYPHSSSNHQEMNARAHLEEFPGEMILEASLNVQSLNATIDRVKDFEPKPKDPEEREKPLSNLLGLIAHVTKRGGENGNRSKSAA